MSTTPEWLKSYGGTPAAIDRFKSYVCIETVAQVYNAWGETKRVPVPFSYWRWHSITAPGHSQDSPDWLDLHGQLRAFMKSGGILVIIGPARAGKTALLERLMPLRIIDNSRPEVGSNAPVSREDVPPELFAVDETRRHDRRDIARLIADMGAENRGFAIVFQGSESFRDYAIGADLAMHAVQFLELVEPGVR